MMMDTKITMRILNIILAVCTFAAGVMAAAPLPPGTHLGFSFGRIWWHNDTALRKDFPVGAFDWNGVSFGLLSVGGGEMRLKKVSVVLSKKTTANGTVNQPDVMGAYLFEYASVGDLPARLDIPPPLKTATRAFNFSTEAWGNDAETSVDLFSIPDPSKTYAIWIIKLTEPCWNSRWFHENFLTFVNFALTSTTTQHPASSSSSTAVHNHNPHSSASSSSLLLLDEQRQPSDSFRGPLFTPTEELLARHRVFTHQNKQLQKRESSGIDQQQQLSDVESSDNDRQIEFFGDSITAGFCNMVWSDDVPNTYATESFVHSWAWLVAERFRAKIHAQAWSGSGLAINCCGPPMNSPSVGNVTATMGRLNLNAVATASLGNIGRGEWLWPYSPPAATTTHTKRFIPQAVVINLGTNDFSGNYHDYPFRNVYNASSWTSVHFVADYKALLTNLSSSYGGRSPSGGPLHAWALCGPMNEAMCARIDDVVTWAATHLPTDSIKVHKLQMPTLASNEMACGHPKNPLGDEKLANETIAAIRQELPW